VIEVAAGVLQRPDGAFLLAQRPAGKVYAGYWEFPGGKIEPGEPAAAALARELHEELGVDIGEAYPWLTRVFTYPHGTVRLQFFRVLSWKNEPHPREDQAISWQSAGTPLQAPMLPANAPVLAALALPVEYGISSTKEYGIDGMLALLERRLQQGLKLLQIREPKLDESERKMFTEKAIGLAHRHGCKVLTKVPFPGADGVHYTATQLMSLDRRSEGMVAASCHTRKELEHAMRLGLDFAVLGPVKDKSPALGWEKLRELTAFSSIPIYAIGGVTRADLREAWRAGAHGVAMIRGAWT
jgi:8-oxo-dGTP diphosphatase